MKILNSHEETANNNANPTSATNNGKGTSTKRLQDISEKIEETKGTGTQTPNPKKAPLNYIDNMGEWEETQKKYEEDIAQKQQELVSILGAYEDKSEETDRFRAAKSELEINLGKEMGIIIDKLKDYDDFLIQVYEKLFKDESEGDNEEKVNVEGDDSKDLNENEKESTENGSNKENPEDENGTIDNKTESEENQNKSNLADEITTMLTALGLNVSGVRVISANSLESQNLGKGELLDNAKEMVNKFFGMVGLDNRNKFKGSLDKTEVEGVESLYAQLKRHYIKYFQLQYQIDLIDAKIDTLENEENSIYSTYYQGLKDTKKMAEDMEKLNETYFLNSYLSTKNVSIDSFVSSPLVEKQISNIIELSKKGLPIPKTILLCGSLNSGKSYAASVLASELGRKMYHIKSYDIFTGGFSDPNAMLDAIFTGAIKKKEPCIIFLDEIESYTHGYDGSPYQNLLENTIRHHISKIKDSNLDIIIIGAISDKKKVNPDLFKQDVFSQQIFFAPLNTGKSEELFNKIIEEKGLKLGKDVNIHKIFEKKLKNIYVDPEYMKRIIAFTIDFHKLNETSNPDNNILSQKDFDDAIDYIDRNINASRIGYYLKMASI